MLLFHFVVLLYINKYLYLCYFGFFVVVVICQVFTFASRSNRQHKGNKQVEQHPLSPLLIGERRDHMTEGEVVLQGLGWMEKKKHVGGKCETS